MEKAYYPSRINTYAELLEFIHELDYEALEIEGIDIHFTAKVDSSKKVEVSIEDIIDTEAQADYEDYD